MYEYPILSYFLKQYKFLNTVMQKELLYIFYQVLRRKNIRAKISFTRRTKQYENCEPTHRTLFLPTKKLFYFMFACI